MSSRHSTSSYASTAFRNAQRQDAFMALTGGEIPPSVLAAPSSGRSRKGSGSHQHARAPSSKYTSLRTDSTVRPEDSASQAGLPRRLRRAPPIRRRDPDEPHNGHYGDAAKTLHPKELPLPIEDEDERNAIRSPNAPQFYATVNPVDYEYVSFSLQHRDSIDGYVQSSEIFFHPKELGYSLNSSSIDDNRSRSNRSCSTHTHTPSHRREPIPSWPRSPPHSKLGSEKGKRPSFDEGSMYGPDPVPTPVSVARSGPSISSLARSRSVTGSRQAPSSRTAPSSRKYPPTSYRPLPEDDFHHSRKNPSSTHSHSNKGSSSGNSKDHHHYHHRRRHRRGSEGGVSTSDYYNRTATPPPQEYQSLIDHRHARRASSGDKVSLSLSRSDRGKLRWERSCPKSSSSTYSYYSSSRDDDSPHYSDNNAQYRHRYHHRRGGGGGGGDTNRKNKGKMMIQTNKSGSKKELPKWLVWVAGGI